MGIKVGCGEHSSINNYYKNDNTFSIKPKIGDAILYKDKIYIVRHVAKSFFNIEIAISD